MNKDDIQQARELLAKFPARVYKTIGGTPTTHIVRTLFPSALDSLEAAQKEINRLEDIISHYNIGHQCYRCQKMRELWELTDNSDICDECLQQNTQKLIKRIKANNGNTRN